MKEIFNSKKYFYISIFLITVGLFSIPVHATGITSANSFVEINTTANDFRARKEVGTTAGTMSISGFDFIITPERTNICQQGQSSSICTNPQFFDYFPSGSASSIVFGDTPTNSYLVFINDDHDLNTDRETMIGEICEDALCPAFTSPK